MCASLGAGRPGAGTPPPAVHVLVIGERGSGKRVIVNTLVERAVLPSGRSVDRREEPNHVKHGFIHFSVLQGVCGNPARAEALTRALRCGSPQSIVLFVIKIEKWQLDQKRVSFNPNDLVTMRAVLMAVPSITTYGVVVHAPSQEVRERDALRRRKEFLDAAMVIIPPARRTPFLFFQGFSPRLHRAQFDSQLDFGSIAADFAGLRRFVLEELRPCRIDPRAVKAVTAAGWEHISQNFDTLRGESRREAVQRTQAQLVADGFPDLTYAEPEGLMGDQVAWPVARVEDRAARTWRARLAEPVRDGLLRAAFGFFLLALRVTLEMDP